MLRASDVREQEVMRGLLRLSWKRGSACVPSLLLHCNSDLQEALAQLLDDNLVVSFKFYF